MFLSGENGEIEPEALPRKAFMLPTHQKRVGKFPT